MRPQNFTERKKLLFRFAALYAASIVLLAIVFAVAGFHISFGDQKSVVSADISSQPLAGNSIASADSLLHARIYRLEQLDKQYTLLPADTGSDISRNLVIATTITEEQAFKKSIDSIEQMSAVYAGAGNPALYKNMISSFRTWMEQRMALRHMAGLRTSAAGSGGQADLLQVKNELLQKDIEITRLKTAIKELQEAGPVNGNYTEASKGEIAALKMAFDDQQKESNQLREKYSRLKTENNALALQVTETKKNVQVRGDLVNNNTTADNKISLLEQKTAALATALSFAQIDCNLDRADVQQMVSNARQRKELLSVSLEALKALAMSGDETTQKKAKEKIIRLNRIANTLHD